MRTKILLAALAATAAFASPAYAQTVSATAEARGTVLQPLTLTRIQHLDFGTVLSSAVAGTVSINADSGARAVTGGVSAVATGPGSRGLFDGAGSVGQTVQLALTSPALLVSGANVITVSSMGVDSAGLTRTVNAAGTFQVGVGGTFAIAANQPNGLYTANFTLTAQYQ